MKALFICLLVVGVVRAGEVQEKKRRCRKVTNDFNKCTTK